MIGGKTNLKDLVSKCLYFIRVLTVNSDTSNENSQRDRETETMFTEGAITCSVSVTIFSLIATISTCIIGFIYRDVISIENRGQKFLFIDAATEFACIAIALNMSVAFLTFTLQNKTFRAALLADKYNRSSN